jgi:hypothetical protein
MCPCGLRFGVTFVDDPKNDSLEDMLPKHSDVAILIVTLGMLLAGSMLGVALALVLAPGSSVALLIGLVLLPCAHVAGRFAWAVTGFAVDPKSEGRRAVRAITTLGRWVDEPRAVHDKRERGAFEGRFPRGGATFVLVHTLFAFAAGLTIGLALADTPVTTVVCAYTIAGTVYGAVVIAMARRGYLLMRSERAK